MGSPYHKHEQFTLKDALEAGNKELEIYFR